MIAQMFQRSNSEFVGAALTTPMRPAHECGPVGGRDKSGPYCGRRQRCPYGYTSITTGMIMGRR